MGIRPGSHYPPYTERNEDGESKVEQQSSSDDTSDLSRDDPGDDMRAYGLNVVISTLIAIAILYWTEYPVLVLGYIAGAWGVISLLAFVCALVRFMFSEE